MSLHSEHTIALLARAVNETDGMAGICSVLSLAALTPDERMFEAIVGDKVLAQRLSTVGQVWRATHSPDALDHVARFANVAQDVLEAFVQCHQGKPLIERTGDLFDALCGHDETLRCAVFAKYAGSDRVFPRQAAMLAPDVMCDASILERYAPSAWSYAKRFAEDATLTIGGLAAYTKCCSTAILATASEKGPLREIPPGIVAKDGRVLRDLLHVFSDQIGNDVRKTSDSNYRSSFLNLINYINRVVSCFNQSSPGLKASCTEIIEAQCQSNMERNNLLVFSAFAQYGEFRDESPVFGNFHQFFGHLDADKGRRIINGNLMHFLVSECKNNSHNHIREIVSCLARDARFDRLCDLEHLSPLALCLGENYKSPAAEALLRSGWRLDAHDGVAIQAAKLSARRDDDPGDPVPGLLRSHLAYLEISSAQPACSDLKPL